MMKAYALACLALTLISGFAVAQDATLSTLRFSARDAKKTEPSEDLFLVETYELEGETYHVQGIELEFSNQDPGRGEQSEIPRTLLLSSVNKKEKKGHLLRYEFKDTRTDLARKEEVEIHDGLMYHPGGFQADQATIWIPVAEYRPLSKSVVQKRNRRTLELEFQFEVDDHIGALAIHGDQLIGANWDARQLYWWDRTGELIKKMDNPYPTHYQDMKIVRSGDGGGNILVASGGALGFGRVDVLHPDDLTRIAVGKIGRTDRRVIFTHEGMDVDLRFGNKPGMLKYEMWFLPEDTPSRLFRFWGVSPVTQND